MAYYDALIAAWNNPTQPPPGVTSGSGLLPTDTTAQKVNKVNRWIVAAPQPAIFVPYKILNAIVDVDLAALTPAQVSQFTLMLSGAEADLSPGTALRSTIQGLFAGKTQTIQQLRDLVAPFDNATMTWCQQNVYPFNSLTAGGLTTEDAKNAGLT
jgi:hypothetical protein